MTEPTAPTAANPIFNRYLLAQALSQGQMPLPFSNKMSRLAMRTTKAPQQPVRVIEIEKTPKHGQASRRVLIFLLSGPNTSPTRAKSPSTNVEPMTFGFAPKAVSRPLRSETTSTVEVFIEGAVEVFIEGASILESVTI